MDEDPAEFDSEEHAPADEGGMPSALVYRGSLVALVVGTLLAVFLFVRPPQSESKGEPTRTIATATRAVLVTATPTASATSGPSPTPAPTAEAGSPTAAPNAERSHTVQSGQTLSEIATQFNTTVDAILALNPGVTPANLQIGATLRIPPAP